VVKHVWLPVATYLNLLFSLKEFWLLVVSFVFSARYETGARVVIS
jgi:hypothetical protein